MKLVAEKSSRRLLGAKILAPEAGEIIQIAALAIRRGMTQELGDLGGPSVSRLLRRAARDARSSVAGPPWCAGAILGLGDKGAQIALGASPGPKVPPNNLT